MRCLWLEDGRLRLRDVPRPVPGPDEALIKVRLAGICRTDLELIRGYYPFSGIPGHEFVGEVVDAASKPRLMGKRVVGEINAWCGACDLCRAGHRTHCERRSVLGIVDRHGVFAEYLTLPVRNLHEVPDQVTDDVAVFAEPLAAACEIPLQVPMTPADRVLVVGAGRLGQLVARVLARTGCRLKVVARYPGQRKLLTGAGIATVDPSGIRAYSFDRVVEVSGSPEGFTLARQALRPRGTLIVKSTFKGRVSVDISSLVVDEITLVGSRCGPLDQALSLLAGGEIDPRPLTEARYSLERALDAFDHARRSGAMKVLVEPRPEEE